MSNDSDSGPDLPSSVDENIDTIAEFYAQHEQQASATQRLVEKFALFLGSPTYVVLNILFIACWIGANTTAYDLGWEPVDEPPFFWLQGIISLNAFVISTTVLIRQNRMSKLADHHAHLDLQVNLLTDEKTSKIIQLLDELRRDIPGVRSKRDDKAEELAKPADPKAVLTAIERERDEPYGEAGRHARRE
jgi:uncharacterized membrane protein